MESLAATNEDISTLLDQIRKRRSFSLKELRPDPVPHQVIEEIIEAAQWAPNHGHTEPWRFTVYAGEKRRGLGQALAEAYRLATSESRFSPVAQEAQRNKVWLAPVWVSIGVLPGTNPNIPEMEEIIAVGMAVQNMFLVAGAHGLGSKWTSGLTATHPHTAAFVGLAPPARLLGFFYLGWPAVPWPDGQRTGLVDKVRWEID